MFSFRGRVDISTITYKFKPKSKLFVLYTRMEGARLGDLHTSTTTCTWRRFGRPGLQLIVYVIMLHVRYISRAYAYRQG